MTFAHDVEAVSDSGRSAPQVAGLSFTGRLPEPGRFRHGDAPALYLQQPGLRQLVQEPSEVFGREVDPNKARG